MDRLYVVILAAALLAPSIACEDKAQTVSPKRSSRVNAVRAKPKAEAPKPKDFCDVLHPAATAPMFELPPLADKAPDIPAGWRWVNIWATWCKPCVEELPRLEAWSKKLKKDGLAEVLLISVDESDTVIETFRKKHPGTPDTLRTENPDVIEAWLTTVGFESGSALPLHVFVDPAGKVRCLRAGGVSENEFDAVQRVITSK